MPINEFLRAWRTFRGFSVSELAERAGLSTDHLEVVEGDALDPPVSTLEAIAEGLEIPTGWLFTDPAHLQLLEGDADEDGDEGAARTERATASDPVLERLLRSARKERELYVLLTALVKSEEPKLIRAAEVNLRSLLKQARTTTVPWQTRPPGNFEPPSD